ncbi:tyrosine-protein kinase RYK-like isoform X1 [Patiria miniata]|uniref:receptor protein-tyrosine kinase n=2 Tax=Patiria miniata TaxID=46514 RepID=A0A913ZG50_PATMI|nr:tyrosine-protein kinase RYK-like isoform X1 [Patiria miniata]
MEARDCWKFCLGLWLFLQLCARISAHMNMYMTEAEVARVLGMEAELYFIRDDHVQLAATRYDMAIKSNINSIYFNWVTERQVFYSMSLKSDNTWMMSNPGMNISMDGEVPRTEKTFAVTLHCTGKQGGEVGFTMQVNLTLFSAKNITSLNFRRRKMCERDITIPVDLKTPTPEERAVDVDVIFSEEQPEKTVTSTSVFYISVGVVCGVILLLVMLVALVHVRSMKNSDPASETSSSRSTPKSTAAKKSSPTTYTKAPAMNGHVNSNGVKPHNGYIGLHHQIYTTIPETPDYTEKLHTMTIDRSRITIEELLLEGTFGRVYHGKLLMSVDDEEETATEKDVLLKTVSDQSSETQEKLLLKESCHLHGLSHRNILSIMHVCLDGKPMSVFAYMNLGNLKTFLRNGRVGPGDTHQSISTKDLVQLAIQISHGMMYLGKRKVVHKDLATRNCVIDEDYNLKITDNALSRDLFPSDYHCLGDNENRPVKWMAIESLLDRKFTAASDVWAFGILIWELVTLGQTPYADLDAFEMASYLKSGYRMPQPQNCPDELFSLMACCWALLPTDRPKFTQLCAALTDFHRALGIYI